MDSTVRVEILNGLPGSGKTYYANTEKQKFNEKNHWSKEAFEVIDMDQESIFRPQFFTSFRERLIVDGLFLTNESIINLINELKKKNYAKKKLEFIIIHWKEDRDACLHNDKNRRNTSSKLTIKKAKFEYPDKKKIKEKTGYDVEIIEKDIMKKPEEFNKLEEDKKYGINGEYIISAPWVVGGQNRSYDSDWHNIYSPIEGEEQPEFDELFSFLEKVCPQISFIHVRHILKNFVKIREFEENDYYSRTFNKQYVCDLKKLTEFLIENGYIKGE